MPGEHWCSFCEENLSKHKGIYAKLYWRNFDDEMEIINIVCPDCQLKDERLNIGLKYLEDKAKPVEIIRGRVCTFCGESIKKKEKSFRAEFRYDSSELRCDVCEKCLGENESLKGIKPKKQNPIFSVDVSCNSINKCESFKKPKKDRGINCGHVCVNFDGELYCRRGHPGNVKIYRERWALPPNRKQLMIMLKDMKPLFKQMSEQAKTALEKRQEYFKTIEENKVKAQPIEFPETFDYDIRYFPIENSQITLPWNARIINIESEKIVTLIPIEE